MVGSVQQTQDERIDFHGHPVFGFPTQDGPLDLVRYTRLAHLRGITAPPLTDYHQETRFKRFFLDSIIPREWDVQPFNDGNVVFAAFDSKPDRAYRTIYFHTQELVTPAGHILLVGGTKNLRPRHTLEDSLKEAEANGRIIIADHPFIPFVRGGLGYNNVDTHLDRIDALEHNAQAQLFDHRVTDYAAKKLAEGVTVRTVSNSDLHTSYLPLLPFFRGTLDSLGKTYNEFNALSGHPNTWLATLKADIQSGNYSEHIEYSSLSEVLRWHVAVAGSIVLDKFRKTPGRPN